MNFVEYETAALENFCKIQRKKSAMETLFFRLEISQWQVFSCELFPKFFGIVFLENTGEQLLLVYSYLEKIYLFKVDNRNGRKSFEICSELTFKKTPERRQ